MNLKQFRDLLLTLTDDVFHYEAWDVSDNYIVWAEEMEKGSSYADDKKVNQTLTGTVDFYTSNEYSPMVTQIQNLLNENGISWKLESIQYEKDPELIHYEWSWEVEQWLD